MKDTITIENVPHYFQGGFFFTARTDNKDFKESTWICYCIGGLSNSGRMLITSETYTIDPLIIKESYAHETDSKKREEEVRKWFLESLEAIINPNDIVISYQTIKIPYKESTSNNINNITFNCSGSYIIEYYTNYTSYIIAECNKNISYTNNDIIIKG